MKKRSLIITGSILILLLAYVSLMYIYVGNNNLYHSNVGRIGIKIAQYIELNKGVFPGSETQLIAQGFVRTTTSTNKAIYEVNIGRLSMSSTWEICETFKEYTIKYGASTSDEKLIDGPTRKAYPLTKKTFPLTYISDRYWRVSEGWLSLMESFNSEETDNTRICDMHNMKRCPLHEAAEQGDLPKVQSLLSRGADVNAIDTGLFTPLHIAVTYGHEDMVKVLIEHGANVNACDTGGFTPLHVAAVRGHAKIAEILIQHGAGVNIRNNNESTPLNVANKFGHERIAEIITNSN